MLVLWAAMCSLEFVRVAYHLPRNNSLTALIQALSSLQEATRSFATEEAAACSDQAYLAHTSTLATLIALFSKQPAAYSSDPLMVLAMLADLFKHVDAIGSIDKPRGEDVTSSLSDVYKSCVALLQEVMAAITDANQSLITDVRDYVAVCHHLLLILKTNQSLALSNTCWKFIIKFEMFKCQSNSYEPI